MKDTVVSISSMDVRRFELGFLREKRIQAYVFKSKKGFGARLGLARDEAILGFLTETIVGYVYSAGFLIRLFLKLAMSGGIISHSWI